MTMSSAATTSSGARNERRKLGLPEDKLIVTLDRHANTSAASVPLALDVAWRDGRIRAGQTVLLQGVGGGFTWGSVLVKI